MNFKPTGQVRYLEVAEIPRLPKEIQSLGCPACAAGVPFAAPKIKVVRFYDPMDMGNGVVQVTAELEQPAAEKAKPVELNPETVLRAVYAGKQLLYVSKDKE